MRVLPWLLLLVGFDAWAQTRIIPHVTRPGGGFETLIAIGNTSDSEASVHFNIFLENGTISDRVTEVVPPLTTLYRSPSDWPGDGDASHLTIESDGAVIVNASYRAQRENAGPAHVSEAPAASRFWRLYPGDTTVTWDGLAAVNLGSGNADVVVRQVNADGSIEKTVTALPGLAAMAKGLYLFANDFENKADSHFEILSSEAIVLVALRGNLASDFLWENVAVPFDTPPASRADVSAVNACPDINFGPVTDIQQAGDGSNRLFVVNRSGLIQSIDPATDPTSATPFLDISERVLDSGESGLLGLAFHPNFAQNGTFFVNYSTNSGGSFRSVIARYNTMSIDPSRGDESSETILFEVPQPFTNHNGGALAFGPDGYLYIALGDGGSGGDPQNNAQTNSNLLGTICRIDVDNVAGGLNYAIPADNPFANSNFNERGEIYAYGLRNPWRISFDGDNLWAADVGQDAFEEIDLIVNGGNYGWRITEGFNCFAPPTGCDQAGLVEPVFAYSHTTGSRSITGGYVYRGKRHPDLVGHYIYGDFISGRIWALHFNGTSVLANIEIAQVGSFQLATFGIGEDGELYIGLIDGRVMELSESQ